MTTPTGAMKWLTAQAMQRVHAIERMLQAAYAQQEDVEGNVVEMLVDLRKVCEARGVSWERVVRKSARLMWADEEGPGGDV